jgi:hypothetical protein
VLEITEDLLFQTEWLQVDYIAMAPILKTKLTPSHNSNKLAQVKLVCPRKLDLGSQGRKTLAVKSTQSVSLTGPRSDMPITGLIV